MPHDNEMDKQACLWIQLTLPPNVASLLSGKIDRRYGGVWQGQRSLELSDEVLQWTGRSEMRSIQPRGR